MASITGSISGLIPHIDHKHVAEQAAKAKAKKKAIKEPDYCECVACGAEGLRVYGTSRAKQKWYDISDNEVMCLDCAKFFGEIRIGGIDTAFGNNLGGQTNMHYKSVAERIAKAAQEKYCMVLITQKFGAPDGTTIGVECGDIFQITRAGGKSEFDKEPDWRRSKQAASIDIMVGPHPLTLFPHEFSPISFIEIMKLRKAGEITESFVSAGDAQGYFQPVPEVREQIRSTFGL